MNPFFSLEKAIESMILLRGKKGVKSLLQILEDVSLLEKKSKHK